MLSGLNRLQSRQHPWRRRVLAALLAAWLSGVGLALRSRDVCYLTCRLVWQQTLLISRSVRHRPVVSCLQPPGGLESLHGELRLLTSVWRRQPHGGLSPCLLRWQLRIAGLLCRALSPVLTHVCLLCLGCLPGSL